jgi:hypothetical protein
MEKFNIFKVLKYYAYKYIFSYKYKVGINLILAINLFNFTNIFEKSYAKEIIFEKWINDFGGSGDDYFNDVIETSDGNFVVVGHSNSTDLEFTSGGNEDSYVAKYTANGKRLWLTPIAGSGYDRLVGIAELSDGSLIAAGHSNSHDIGFNYTNTNENADYILIKFSSTGTLLWIKNYTNGKPTTIRSMIKTSNDEILCVGFGRYLYSASSANANVLIVKFDKNGNVLWDRNWGGNGDEDPVGRGVIETSDKGYVIATYTKSTNITGLTNQGGYDMGLIKYSSSGDLLWQKS